MAGLEVVVRPVVFPNIRPAPARSLPPADDPEQGVCVIRGNPASLASASYSYSASSSKSRFIEQRRKEDEARWYHKDDNTGEIDRDQYMDVRVAKQIDGRGGKAPAVNDTLKPDKTPNYGGGFSRGDRIRNYYMPVQEADNIEIKKKDIVTDNPDYPGD